MNTTEQIKGQIKDLKNQLYYEKRVKHRHFVKEHKLVFRIMDILFIFAILCNFGALGITDYLTTRTDVVVAAENNETVVFHEANPTNIHDFETAPIVEERQEATRFFFLFIKQAILWGLMFGMYVLQRIRVSDYTELFVMLLPLILIYYLLTADFVHDLGILMGVLA